MKTIKRAELPAINAPLPGGFFTGIIAENGNHYAIVTPLLSEKIVGVWGEYGEDVTGANSYTDSLANTVAMAESGSEVAARVLALRIDGLDDWAISARDVGELQYRAHKPTEQKNYCSFRDGDNASSVPPGYPYTETSPTKTTATQFQDDGEQAFEAEWYLSSTQYSAGTAFSQGFSDGVQSFTDKFFELAARAVRRVLVIQ